MAAWKHVWITGASSGIGADLAVSLARTGATVSISSRSKDKLDALCKQHDNLVACPLDVSDPSAVSQAVQHLEQQHGPIDLAVLAAGIWKPSDPDHFDRQAAEQSMVINYLGVTSSLASVLPGMKERKAGQIAIVSSVSGYRGLPKGAYYAPTKAALISLAESLRPELSVEGIKIQIINPGFVDTPMTRKNTFPMPFLMSVADAVEHIEKGLSSDRFEIAFPWQMVLLLKICRVLPYRFYFLIMRKLVLKA